MATIPSRAKRRTLGPPPEAPEGQRLLAVPELFAREEPAAEETPKRGRGRPREKVMGEEVGFATRVKPETLDDIKAITDGLRLRSQGDTIERAIALLKEHLWSKVCEEVGDMGAEEALKMAYKVD